ncbi:MAG: GNAT family N-acetyltransferase [Myxococcota bacterium]
MTLFAVDAPPEPPLATERLRLRPLRRSDLDALFQAVQETLPELVRWLPWAHPDYGRGDARRFIRQARLARVRNVTYESAIVDLEDHLVGIMGLHRLDWSRRSAGLGYWIRQSAWGHGYATEAGSRTIEHGFQALGLNRIEAHAALQNHASQRVLEKIGFRREGVARGLEALAGRYVDHVQYGLLRDDVLGPEARV